MHGDRAQAVQPLFAASDWNVPVAQSLQTVCALSDWYVPTAQPLHASCCASGWYVPTVQLLHTLCSLSAVYVPAPQSWHALPSLYLPPGQFVHAAPATGDTAVWWLAGHSRQTLCALCASNVPAVQPLQPVS